ncbi:MAG: mechanosensitive ion channel [Proteobacteria bacterium]|nr:mechanosensitive ion channel [Pseudomonadota bacterium]
MTPAAIHDAPHRPGIRAPAARRGWRGVACVAAWAACVLLASGPARADDAVVDGAPMAGAQEFAPVTVDGRTLLLVRGVSALPAAQRARNIEARIRAFAASGKPTDSLQLVDGTNRTVIVGDGQPLLTVLDTDAAVEGVTDRHALAEVDLDVIAQAITQYRLERTGESLVRAAGTAFAVLALAVLGLAALRWSMRRGKTLIRRSLGRGIRAVEAMSFRLLTAQQIQHTIEGAMEALRWLVSALIVFAAVDFVLSLFPWTRLASTYVSALLTDPLRTMWRGVLASIPGLVFITIMAVVTTYLLRFVQLFFAGIASGRIKLRGFAPEWGWPTYRLVRIGVIAFALVVAYPYIPGSGSDAFKGISIFVGLLMSLGAASVVANSLAGYALIYRRTFRTGDRIRVGDIVGDVVDIRQQVTRLKSLKNEALSIPSTTMLTSQVTNYTELAETDGLILHTTVSIGYDTPWRQVEAMLLMAAGRTRGLEAAPAPYVLVTSLEDFYIVYELNAYTREARAMQFTYSALHRNILDVFNEYDVVITSPHYVADSTEAKRVPRAKWFAAPASDQGAPAAGDKR